MITGQLDRQQVTLGQIMEVITDLKYKEGIENIEAAYKVVMQGKDFFIVPTFFLLHATFQYTYNE